MSAGLSFYMCFSGFKFVSFVAFSLCVVAPAIAQLRISPNIGPPIPPPSCVIQDRPQGNNQAALIVAAPASRSIVYTSAINAASEIVLTGASDDRRTYSVTVGSKFAGDTDEAVWACREFAWSPKQGDLVATDRRRDKGSIWMIEIRAPASDLPSRVEILSDDMTPSAEWGNDVAFGLMCENWQPTGPTHHRRAGFAGKVRLDVSIPENGLEGAQLGALKDILFSAAALWVAACRECRPEHLAVIRHNSKLFVRRPLARWIEVFNARPDSSGPHRAEQSLASILENRVFLTTERQEPAIKSLEPYKAVPPTKDFCRLRGSRGKTPVLFSIQQALCGPSRMESGARAKIELRLQLGGTTQCGTDPEIIACRADNVLTELNGRDYRFKVAREAKGSVGLGPVELSLLPVVVHEMGHWIGLPHIDSGKSIMASSAERARCIDEETISLLTEHVKPAEGPESFRLHDDSDPRNRNQRP
jgi:hypothetical protein